MTKKIIFFSIDRLGDYLIRSNIIKNISSNYDSVEIICSEKNYKLISNQKFFNKVSFFNTKKKLINKLIFLKHYFFKKYDTAISFDGKNISYILILFIRAKNKHVYVYKKSGLLNILLSKKLTFLFKLLGINYIFLNNKEIIEKNKLDNYPLKYNLLKNFYSIKSKKIYYLQQSKKNIFFEFKNKYILIHLDEKFNDINDIDLNFEKTLSKFKKNFKKKIFLSSYKNSFDYYKKLNLPKVNFEKINPKILKKSKMLIIENIPINDFQSMINNSFYNISCHAGYVVHTSLALNRNTLDIINEKDQKWVKTWLYKPQKYQIILKTKKYKSRNINEIFLEINNVVNKAMI